MTLRPPADLTDAEILAELEGTSVSDAIDRAASGLEELSRLSEEYPIAAATLWVRDDAPWDQRRLVASLSHPLTLALGGNRSGKTYAILEAAVAFAMGGDHPAVRCWTEDNDLPAGLIPDGPGQVILVAQTGAVSIALHRKPLQALLPAAGVASWNLNTPAEARIEITVPGHTRPAVIWFKSCDAGHRKFKGSEVRFAAITEEPEGDEGRLILEELMRGASSVGGRVVLDMTPQNGMTWVYDDLHQGRRYGCQVVEIDTTHNTLVPDYAGVQRWLGSLTDDERRVRQRGQFVDRKGLIYVEWSRGTGDRWGPGSVCTPFEIPPEWPRFRAADLGLDDPTCCLWGALGDDSTLYVYRGYYARGATYADHGAAIRAMSGTERYRASVGDPSASGRAAMEIWRRDGLFFDDADREVQAGISSVRQWMAIRPDGRPRVKVFSDVPPEVISEIEGYRWDPATRLPIKRRDHAPDALRFLVRRVELWFRL